MRMSKSGQSAAEVVKHTEESELANILWKQRMVEDVTDACAGEPANDSGVTDLLLRRGKYVLAPEDTKLSMYYENVHENFQRIQ